MKGKQRLAGSFLAVAMACAPGCVTGPINIAALLQNATTSQPTPVATPAPVSTESAQPVEKRITFKEGQTRGFALTGNNNIFIMSFLLEGKGTVVEITIFRSGTAPNQYMHYQARLQANSRDVSIVPLINSDEKKFVFKATDGNPLLHVDGPVQMVVRLDGRMTSAEWDPSKNWDPLKGTTTGFTISTASFTLGGDTTLADFPPFATTEILVW